MNPEGWQETGKVLQSVLERAPEQRRAFLDEACAGDSQLRREVTYMLAMGVYTWRFMHTVGGKKLYKTTAR
jgi:hypothetical protein